MVFVDCGQNVQSNAFAVVGLNRAHVAVLQTASLNASLADSCLQLHLALTDDCWEIW